MIELASAHKTGLSLHSPVLGAAGCWGFADETTHLVQLERLGALVTHPLTWQARSPATQAMAYETPAGLLLHTGLPNPGIRTALKQFAGRWERLACPVIAHLACDTPEQTARAVEKLEVLPNVVAVEIGFRADEPANVAREHLYAAGEGLLPVLAQAPWGREWEFAELARQARAQALVCSAPPRGKFPLASAELSGRLYSPAFFPLLLQNVQDLARQVRLPLIACGGVHHSAQIHALLQAGAKAVQLESVVWRDPTHTNQLLQEFWQAP